MIHTAAAYRGMITAPHRLASEAGLRVLRDGGNAIEAMVAAAATIAVVYPHMNSIGGDGFWLIGAPDREPVAIDACGAAGRRVDVELYRGQGLEQIPGRGPLAANTVAGAVSGWQSALELSADWGGKVPLPRLLEDAIHYAEQGVPVSVSQHQLTADKSAELRHVGGFADAFLDADGAAPAVGSRFDNPRLATTLRRLGQDGLDDFYRGALARQLAADLARAGSPLDADDLAAQRARRVTPLSVRLGIGRLYNLTPPTQGLSSLQILALFDRLGVDRAEGFDHLHGLIEATKQAFIVRDRELTDPAYMRVAAAALLSDELLDRLAAAIDRRRALPWPQPAAAGDTVWLGAIDAQGRAVSFIQSIYWEFGSGVVLDDSGVQWQNRGSSFSLQTGAKDELRPGRRPFHTLNPALARFDDGRLMSYGTMGGEGQPQTQAALFSRYALFDQPLQQAVSAPRWLLGRTWGEQSTSLKIESRVDATLLDALRAAGHDVQVVEAFSSLMGHAGALVRHSDGLIEGASDPRSDGVAAGF